MQYIFFVIFTLLTLPACASAVQTQNVASIPVQDLQNFDTNPKPVQHLLTLALELATQNLGYLYGSADPANGGMDCSGTVYYLLTKVGTKNVPRSSDLIYQWVLKTGNFYAVNNREFAALEFSHLRPGDLLFWSGTYEIKRQINVTHVMLYLGKNQNGEPLMVGASNGRTYQGKKVYGVSVFNFHFPEKLSKGKFLGYSCIPSFSCGK